MADEKTAGQQAADGMLVLQRMETIRQQRNEALDALEISDAKLILQHEAIKAYQELVPVLNARIAAQEEELTKLRAAPAPITIQ